MKSLRHTFLAAITLLFVLSPLHAAETRGLSIVAKDKATGQQTEIKLYNKTYAILIGIDRYEDTEIPRLKNAVNDARGVKKVLEQRYRFDDYKEFYDQNATQKNIMEYLKDELADKVTENDAVLVFWAGHGTQQENTRYGDLGYLIPYDGSWKKHSRNISMDTLKNEISKSLKARHIFYVMDACYGGLMTDKRALTHQTGHDDLLALQKIAKEDVRQVLTAGSKGETVLDGINGHSVFTGRLIEALEAQSDFITANEIQAIITRNVSSDAMKQNHSQTPQYGKLYGQGDFVFVPSRDYQMQQLRAEQEQRQRDIDKSLKEQDKINKEMAELAALEQKAKEANNARERRKAEDARHVAEAKLAQERLRQQAMEDEKRRKAQEEAELKKIDEDRKRQLEEARQVDARFRQDDERRQTELQRLEQEQIKKKQEEEQKLAGMRKVAEERRKKTLETATGSLSVDAAVAEIKAADARIAEIRREFDAELGRQKASAEARLKEKLKLLKQGFDQRMAALGQQKAVSVSKPTIDPKGEFETQAQYRERVAKSESEYQQRLAEASSAGNKARQAEEDAYNQAVRKAEEQHRAEIAGLEERTVREKDAQIKPFRERIASISNQEYTMLPGSLTLNLGQYDADKQLFPVSITSRVESSVKVAMNGTIPLPIDGARKFKQEWQGGLVRPEVAVRAGDGQITRMAIVNDADNQRLANYDGEFMTVESKAKREKARREEERRRVAAAEAERKKLEAEREQKLARGERFSLEGRVIEDLKLGLQWAPANGQSMNHYDAEKYAQNLSLAGGGWRLPTRAELKSLYDTSKPGKADPVFGVGDKWVWTSKLKDSSGAWYFYFNNGYENPINRAYSDDNFRVLAVRSRR